MVRDALWGGGGGQVSLGGSVILCGGGVSLGGARDVLWEGVEGVV